MSGLSPVKCDTEDTRNDYVREDGTEGEHSTTELSLKELVEVLHAAPHSCRHGDEVWPNLYLGDM